MGVLIELGHCPDDFEKLTMSEKSIVIEYGMFFMKNIIPFAKFTENVLVGTIGKDNDTLITDMISYWKDNKSIPSLSVILGMGYTFDTVSKYGGIKNLKLYVKQSVTKSLVDVCKTFLETNDKFPKLSDLLSQGFTLHQIHQCGGIKYLKSMC